MAKARPGETLLKRMGKNERLISKVWDSEFCGEHDGSVASFRRANKSIPTLAQYHEVFTRDSANLAVPAGIAAGAAVGVLAIAGTAVTAGGGPAAVAAALGKMGLLGAAGTGTAISSLAGGALANASLAAIGGSMAAGTMIVSAVGLGLGGAVGAGVSYKYLKDDPSFKISRIRKNSGDRVVFINGFLQKNESKFEDWKDGHLECFPDNRIYGLNWSSKEMVSLGGDLLGVAGPTQAGKVLARAAAIAKKNAGKALGPYVFVAIAAQIMGNSWHVAMANAAKAGSMLADAIVRTKETNITLVGHSLGARVIFYALEALSTRPEVKVWDVILLGGAVGRSDRHAWRRAGRAVSGSIYNCYSSQDRVLSYLYRFGNLGISDPVGLGPIMYKGPKIKNIDCSGFVDSHMSWKQHYSDILKIIYPGG